MIIEEHSLSLITYSNPPILGPQIQTNTMSTDADKMGTLRHQLSTLEELFKEVAIQYEAAAATLREGLLPDRTPGFQLDAARKVFTDTLSVLSDVGDTYGLAPVSQNASLPSAQSYLNTVQEAKQELERQQKLISDASMVLSEANLIKHHQLPEMLEPIREAIYSSQSRLEKVDLEEAQKLIDGIHPISKLIAYTNHRDSLSDDEYDSFRLQIEEAFGRAILRDIDRGRIIYTTTIPEQIQPEQEIELEPETTEEVDEPMPAEAQEETQNEIIDIVDESDEAEFDESMMNGAVFHEMSEAAEDTQEVETEEEEVLETEVTAETEPFDETMHDEHEPFWPPSIEESEETISETLNGEFEIDEDFNPEEDTITGRLS